MIFVKIDPQFNCSNFKLGIKDYKTKKGRVRLEKMK